MPDAHRPTDALQVALGGPDAGDFAIVSDGCAGTVLAPAAGCDVHLVFRPSSPLSFDAAGDTGSFEVGGPAWTARSRRPNPAPCR